MPSFPFDFELPPGAIAQHPASPRDASRLLVVDRTSGSLAHRRFHELPELLRPGDLLVLNDSRVVPARLLGKRQKTGGKWEGLFLRQLSDGAWELICQAGGKLQPGETILVEPGPLRLFLERHAGPGRWVVRPRLENDSPVATLEILEQVGSIPLPPYIRAGKADEADRSTYQTVYAQEKGSAAAPTAGLHFTPDLFSRLNQQNILSSLVTLHVGLGTFQPIKTDDYSRHVMHAEFGRLAPNAVEQILDCKKKGVRVVAVGTTTVRVLESAALAAPPGELLAPWSGETSIFIHPPFPFRVVDALITNFHLPRSTLLLLVSAFAGSRLAESAYRTAIAEGYRFYSYGDAMLIL